MDKQQNKPIYTTLALITALYACGDDATPAAAETETRGGESSGNGTTAIGTGEGSTGETTVTDASNPGSEESPSSSEGALNRCGDGIVDTDELCDDGLNDGQYDGCMPGCAAFGPRCGDGIVQNDAAERCDYADAASEQACNPHCQIRGTVLDTIYTVVDREHVASADAQATKWNGALTVAFSGYPLVVWEIDTDTMETKRIRSNPEVSILPLTGALGLPNGNLLLAGGQGYMGEAVVLGPDLDVQWVYEDPNAELWNGYTRDFVGVAPLGDGAMLGGTRVDYDLSTSAHWVTGITSMGATSWQAIDTHDVDGYWAWDFRPLGHERGVLLLDGPTHGILNPFSTFRIYDNQGETVADQPYAAAGSNLSLCAGEHGFFLFRSTQGEAWDAQETQRMTGYDSDGSATFNIDFTYAVDGWSMGTGCAVLTDNSPLLALNLQHDDSTSTLALLGFEGNVRTWTTRIETELSSRIRPVVYFEEARSRAWIFETGPTALESLAYIRATIVAI